MNQLHLRWPLLVRVAALMIALLTISTLTASAQSTSAGTITGTVTDASDAVIPGVTVTITDAATKTTRTVLSNGSGLYVFTDVLPGDYSITATRAGFSMDEIPSLTVSVGAQSTANFKMAVGAANTTVEVTETNADLQTLNASTSETVAPIMVDSLPSIGRDASTFASFMPGVSPSGSDAGTTSDQVVYQLDGGSNSDDMSGNSNTYTVSLGNSTTGGFLAASSSGVMPMPQDSVDEFSVATSGQTADFNNSSGMQASVVTKRGHEHWNGTAYEYYLDSNIGANTWQDNFPNIAGVSSYTPKASYHYSRYGIAGGGPILPYMFGGKTYIFANYEGFSYPNSITYERTVPSYQYLQQGQLTFPASASGTTYSAAQLMAADPRGIGMNQTLAAFYNSQLPVAPASNTGSVGATGATYAGSFDPSCGSLSTSYCDGVNTIGFRGNVAEPESSKFLAVRIDHNFGPKWQLMASYRYFNLSDLTDNQVDIGGQFAGDKIGTPAATAPRPQQPWYLVIGVNTNVSSSLTNDFHYSYLRNSWQYKSNFAPPQITGADGAIEPLGEEASGDVLSPYNVNSQSIRTRNWDGKDNYFRDDVTKLKGNHLIQVGGQYQHNFAYFQRSDNGNSINFTPTFQIGDVSGGGKIAYSSTGLGSVGANANANYARILDTYYGLVTDTQVADTYNNSGGTLTLNPPLTPIHADVHVPYYNLYGTDTWKVKPSLTINFGLSYAIEMPPMERTGTEVMWTDATGKALNVEQWLSQRKTAALAGQVYNPEIAFTLLHDVLGNRKYPYNPFYGALSPRVAFAWAPAKLKNVALSKLFGNNETVIRGGYGRIYGRINGGLQVLAPITGPGPILGTQCAYAQSPTTGTGSCTQSNYNDTTAYRFGSAPGLDGVTPVLATAPLPTTLPQPYHPGFDGPGVATANPIDPNLRPNDVDTFNLSIQRQIGRKMLVEVGYIGRLIHHDYIQMNPNAVPYMMNVGGQSFESAYGAIEGAFGCTSSSSQCATSAVPTTTVAPQPFFESALGGAGSPYCAGYSSCTAAVVAKQASNFRNQEVFNLWQALDNNVNGANGAGFTFARSMMGTTTSNAAFGGAGQVATGMSMNTSNGHSNYNGGYVSFKTTDFHGITLQENLTYSKALGLGTQTQTNSGEAAEDPFNLNEQYGRQSFDQKIIFNTFVVYQTPWYSKQIGILGRLLGGWTISPVVTAGTGQPLVCTTNNGGQNFGGEDGNNFVDSENCVFTTPYNGGYHTHRGVVGGEDSFGIHIGTSYHAGALSSSAVNMFTNPVAVYDTTRPPILGLDLRDSGDGPISGLPYLNIDMSIKKKIVVWGKDSLELSGVFYNVMNHLDFTSPSLSINSSSSFGVTKTQGNSPREIQMGLRAYF
jgi:hypothetical protein